MSALRRALWHPDPKVRVAAAEVAGAQSLRRYGPLLAEWILSEPDRSIQLVMARVIDLNQWEPTSDEIVVQLRTWARQQIAAALPTPKQSSPPVKPRPQPTRTKGEVWIVTGVGGPAGVAVLRAMMQRGYKVVGVDSSPMAVGLGLAEAGRVVPRADDPDFSVALADIARETGTVGIIPTVVEEMMVLWADQVMGMFSDRTAHKEMPAALWLPPPMALERCYDKWAFARRLGEAGLEAPPTALGEMGDVPGPWVVKPRFGRGSRDIWMVDSPKELEVALKRVTDPLVQHRLEGREFTVDVLVERGGALAGAVPRWRDATRGGVSTAGTTFSCDHLLDRVAGLVQVLGLEGPACVQGFMDGDEFVGFTEVNPRFSGGLPLSLAAGSDLVGEYVRGVLGQPLRRERLSYRVGVEMRRHFDEVFCG
jgi:carbamoyl-phosphate synthase large subunit